MTTPTPTQPTTNDRSARLNMRLSPETLATIREAAAAQSQDVTAFVLGAASERARAVLMEDRLLRLTPAGLEQLESALDAEPRVIPELAALIREVKGSQVRAPRQHATPLPRSATV